MRGVQRRQQFLAGGTSGSWSTSGAAAFTVTRALLVCDLLDGLCSSFAFVHFFFWVESPSLRSMVVSNRTHMWLL